MALLGDDGSSGIPPAEWLSKVLIKVYGLEPITLKSTNDALFAYILAIDSIAWQTQQRLLASRHAFEGCLAELPSRLSTTIRPACLAIASKHPTVEPTRIEEALSLLRRASSSAQAIRDAFPIEALPRMLHLRATRRRLLALLGVARGDLEWRKLAEGLAELIKARNLDGAQAAFHKMEQLVESSGHSPHAGDKREILEALRLRLVAAIKQSS